MVTERTWDTVWLSIFTILLVSLSQTLLPPYPAWQLVVVPGWICYWLMTRRRSAGLWLAVWGGLFLGCAWTVPPGCAILFFLGLWYLRQTFREQLPMPITPLHGLIGGMVLAPLLRLWIWLYALLWWGPTAASALAPGLGGFFIMPAAGALGGGAVFALAKAFEFRVMAPPNEKGYDDED